MKFLISESQLNSVTDSLKNSIIRLATKKLGMEDLEFEVEIHHEKIYLILVVDCMKMDKNTNEFDEKYYRLLTRQDEKKPSGLFLGWGWEAGVMDKVIKQFKKGTNIELHPHFNYKNYDYIDKIEEIIQNAVKKSSCPDVQIDFSGRGEIPKLTLGFYNVPPKVMNDGINFDNFIKELEDIMENKIDFSSYSIMRTMGDLQ